MDHGICVLGGNLYCSEVALLAPEISLRCQVYKMNADCIVLLHSPWKTIIRNVHFEI